MSKVFGVICSALIFLPNQTIGFINSVGNFSSLMKTMVSCRNVFLTQYDRRLLSLALLSIFRLKVQQEEIDEDALKWFETTILILHVQRLEEEIKGLKAASLHTKDKRKKLFKETKSDEEKRDFTLYNMIIGRGIDLDKLLEDDEPSPNNNDADDILQDLINYVDSAKLSAQRSVHKLQSPLNKVDEFVEFQKIFSDFKLLLGVSLEPQVLERISSIARECLVGVLKSHKLTFGANSQQTIEGVPTLADQPNAPRKIAKLKERNTQTPTGQFQVQGGMIPPHLN